MAKIKKQDWRWGVLFLTLLIGFAAGWLWWQDSISPVDQDDVAPVNFVIDKGEGVRTITADLVQARLIKSAPAFYLLIKLRGMEKQIQAGEFHLSRNMDALAIAQALTHGSFDTRITLLEGWRIEEIATKLARELDIPESEFLKYAQEGYMFPDTYMIARDATAAAVVKLLRDTFAQKVNGELASSLKRTDLNLNQVIIMASIVEREGRSDADRSVIAGILLKRLVAGWPLEVDATLQYALGYQAAERSWWKRQISTADKQLASPFNTYRQPGLPPSPIANPGFSAIRAVLIPTVTDYWFYLHDQAGGVHYAKTLEEHSQNIARYLIN